MRKHYDTNEVSLVFSTIPQYTDLCAALVLLLPYLLYTFICARLWQGLLNHSASWVTGGQAPSPYSTNTQYQSSTATIFRVTHGAEGQTYEGWNFNFGNTPLDWIQELLE